MSEGMFQAFDISASGCHAQGARMDVIAQNIANAQTTRTASGEPYRRRQIVFSTSLHDATGVVVDAVVEDTSDYKMLRDPGHPDADSEGMVRLPNVNIPLEMVDMVAASRAYQANLAVMKHFQDMANCALYVLR